jgi:hypothetical protein
MSRLLLLLALVCALLPRSGLAQTPDTRSPPDDAPVVAPPLVSASDEVEPAPPEPPPITGAPVQTVEEPRVSAVPRVILELLAGGAGSLSGGILGVIAGVVISGCNIFDDTCPGVAAAGLVGLALGPTLTTYTAGSLMKGRGSFLGTLIGAAVGTGTGLLLILSDNDGDTIGPLSLMAMPAIGATMGYELSRVFPVSSSFSLTGPSVPVAPAFGTTRHGGFVGGLTGRF